MIGHIALINGGVVVIAITSSLLHSDGVVTYSPADHCPRSQLTGSESTSLHGDWITIVEGDPTCFSS